MADKVLSDDQFNNQLRDILDSLRERVLDTRYWDRGRTPQDQGGAQLYDSEKPIESWILWMEEYLAKARAAATGNKDKSEAYGFIVKVTVLAINCLIHGPRA